MHRAFLLLLVCGFFTCSGQDRLQDDLQSLIHAEEAFILMAKEQNTRDAFLHFLSDSAVTASRGQGPRKGKTYLEGQQRNDSWLSWKPVFTDMAASGDFGYNTGPWAFRVKRSDAEPVAYGQFVSIWKKDKEGEWKVALDMGISHGKPSADYRLTTSGIRTLKSAPGNKRFLSDLEKSFTAALKAGHERYEEYISSEARAFRPGAEPFHNPEAVKKVLQPVTPAPTYSFAGGEIASSGDLAYAYGTATIPQTNSTEAAIHSYLRIWKKEAGGWKLVLDLLSD